MRPLYIILLILWFIVSYVLCNKYFTCTPADTSVSAAASGAAAATSDEGCVAEIKFEDGDFMIASSENFRFGTSEESQNEPSQVLTGVVDKVVDYMEENPDRFMQLTGYYMDGEENATDFDNLGIARAKNVREYLKDAGISGTQLTTSSEMVESACIKDGILLKGISVKFDEIPSSN